MPVAFFELWPVKGFQYLLPIAPPLAVLAGRPVAVAGRRRRRLALLAAAIVAASLLIPTWDRIRGSATAARAGRRRRASGRARGRGVDRRRTSPRDRRFMTIGPSMANLVQYYGHRKAYGLSVSPNPLNRNPSYEPLAIPIRRSATTSSSTSSGTPSPRRGRRASRAGCSRYARRYNGRAVHTRAARGRRPRGLAAQRPAIVVFEVRP